MLVRTTVFIPTPLHHELRRRAETSGTSIRALILRALEEAYAGTGKGKPVTGPLVSPRGKLGSRFPSDETPHDLILS
jgi:hypothetical protein